MASDDEIIAEIKRLLPHAQVWLADQRRLGKTFPDGPIVEWYVYVADRVRPKYGLSTEHFERLYRRAT